jgi:hypothetical protein
MHELGHEGQEEQSRFGIQHAHNHALREDVASTLWRYGNG